MCLDVCKASSSHTHGASLDKLQEHSLPVPATASEAWSGVSTKLANGLLLSLHHKANSTQAVPNRPTEPSQVQQQQVMTVTYASPEHD